LFALLGGQLVYDVYAVDPAIAPEALITSTTAALENGFGVNWDANAKADFVRSYLEVKSEAMTLHPGADTHISVENV